MDGQEISETPIEDATFGSGTVVLEASANKKDKDTNGVVKFDDFTISQDGAKLLCEDFDDPVLFAFQDIYYSRREYALVKDACMEVKGLVSYLVPKRDLEASRF